MLSYIWLHFLTLWYNVLGADTPTHLPLHYRTLSYTVSAPTTLSYIYTQCIQVYGDVGKCNNKTDM